MSAAAPGSRPLRVYMDQSAFGVIADALRRQHYDSPHVGAYEHLRSLVSTGRVRIYFSVIHVIEGLRFRDVASPLAAAYCEAVDALTLGHCVRDVGYLHRAELELALADLFGFPTEHDRERYPYGRYLDALDSGGITPQGDGLGG